MKLNTSETFDRFQQFTKKNFSIEDCCQNLIDQRPFGSHAFYIFAHTRTDDDGVTKRLIWQPRLTKPRSQSNSMLFKAYPGSDIIKVIWMIPSVELWAQYTKGKMLENKTVCESIHKYKNDRKELDAPESDDLSDEAINQIYTSISRAANFPNVIC